MLHRKVPSKLYHLRGEEFMAKFPKSHTEMFIVTDGWLALFRQMNYTLNTLKNFKKF